MYLFFDTETTGLPKNWKAPLTDFENWPRLVQIAWILTDEQGNVLEADDYIIKPEGFSIPLDVVRFHGITTEKALTEGAPLKEVLLKFASILDRCKLLVAHNINYDRPIVTAEFLRLKLPHDPSKLPAICTQLASTNYCKLPGNYGDYKWPKLAELHKKLFNSNFVDPHNASVDVRACLKCFFELKRLGVISLDALKSPV